MQMSPERLRPRLLRGTAGRATLFREVAVRHGRLDSPVASARSVETAGASLISHLDVAS